MGSAEGGDEGAAHGDAPDQGEGQQPQGQQGSRGEGDGDGGRRRRRGRRGGRRRGRRSFEQGEGQQPQGQDPFIDPRYPATPAEPYGVNDDGNAPQEQERAPAPPPPRRIEGPGDAYDWPWNRRAERFPDEVAREQEAAQRAAESPHEPEPMAPLQHSAPPTAPREPELAVQPAPMAPQPEAPTEPEPPAGPPR
jgi:ribonuclease E